MTDWVDDGEGGFYGLGLEYLETDFGDVYGHSGASSGFQSNVIYVPDSDVVVVVLTNNFDAEFVEDLTQDALAAVG
jgi:D-alanyl-D-alanine carboxypeptidase